MDGGNMNNKDNKNEETNIYSGWEDKTNNTSAEKKESLAVPKETYDNYLGKDLENEEKPYTIVKPKDRKKFKILHGFTTLITFSFFIVVGIYVFYMMRVDKYEFYINKNDVLLANHSSYQIELTPKNSDVFDYKNYVYIENEDSIIPKQLLNAHNKKYAIKATKENCYLSVDGAYLPAYDKKLFTNEKLFKHSLHDKQSYINISTHMDDKEFIRYYVINLIKHII